MRNDVTLKLAILSTHVPVTIATTRRTRRSEVANMSAPEIFVSRREIG